MCQRYKFHFFVVSYDDSDAWFVDQEASLGFPVDQPSVLGGEGIGDKDLLAELVEENVKFRGR